MNKVTLIKLGVVAVAATLLAGCENDAASYQIDGKEHALILMRDQRYFWSDNTDLKVVVARLPDCQRRYDLNSAPLPKAQMSIYEVTQTQYQLQQGDHWYVADTGGWTLQPLDGAPDVPGKLLGTFDRKDDRLRFIPVAAPAAAPGSAAAPEAPAAAK